MKAKLSIGKETASKFTNIFHPVFNYGFDDTEQLTGKVLYLPRDNKEKICLFCGERFPEVTFRSKSHIIPESLGNKHLRYKNECDECNHNNGRKLDQELQDFLSCIRAFSRKRGKTGIYKYKIGESPSFIQSDASKNTISIESLQDDDKINVMEEKTNKSLKITLALPPINYVSIAKNMARMALMCLPFNEAKNKNHLIDWITGKLEYLPTYLWGFKPGPGLRYTALHVFRNREHVVGYGDYGVFFFFGFILMYIQLPNLSMIQPSKIIMPFPIHEDLNLKVIRCEEDKKKTGEKVQIEIKYGRSFTIHNLLGTNQHVD